jgi:hypothetical protein
LSKPRSYMFWFVITLLIGEYCCALIVKLLFRLRFNPVFVPVVTVVVGFAAFFIFMVVLILKAFS